MRATNTGVKILLFVLFIGAVWGRTSSLGDPIYPYYKGESGTNFRHAQQIATDGRLVANDERAAWPEGYAPSRAKPNGVEYFSAFAYRLTRPFTDMSEKRFVRWLTVLVFSLSVFVLYALARKLWASRAAGICAAFLVAFSTPLIGVTNGSEYLHVTYAAVVIAFHLLFFVGYVARPTLASAIATGVAGFVLFGIWEDAGLYVGLSSLACLLYPKWSTSDRLRILTAHLAALVLAGFLLPHLRAQRYLLDWPAVWIYVATAYVAASPRLTQKLPGWVIVGTAFVAISLLLKPIQHGGVDALDPLTYWLYRFRFVVGKPDDPTQLPPAIRYIWSVDRSHPPGFFILAFFLPLVFLVPPAVAALRDLQRQKGHSVWFPIPMVLLGTALFLVDRRAIVLAAPAVMPFVSGALCGFHRHLKTRGVPVVIGALLFASSSPLVLEQANIVHTIGTGLGLSPVRSGEFVRVSIGNPDREVVRYLLTRTSTRNDVVLAVPDMSSLVTTFGGRATVLAPGVFTQGMTQKIVETLSAFYGDEKGLYTRCEALGVTYVLYSIDLLLDSSRHSLQYTAGFRAVGENSVAYDMHFAPETLEYFRLVYENDTHRLFEVTAQIKPVFLTDHPPVYQESILRVHGDDLESFYERIVDILATYRLAVTAQARGDEEGAVRRFRYCLDQAPRFTKAWLGLGDSLLRLRNPDSAYAAYNRVLEYSPDDRHALYYAALSLAYLDRRAEALRLIDLLFSSTANREIRSQAGELKAILESGRPLVLPQ